MGLITEGPVKYTQVVLASSVLGICQKVHPKMWFVAANMLRFIGPTCCISLRSSILVEDLL